MDNSQKIWFSETKYKLKAINLVALQKFHSVANVFQEVFQKSFARLLLRRSMDGFLRFNQSIYLNTSKSTDYCALAQ